MAIAVDANLGHAASAGAASTIPFTTSAAVASGGFVTVIVAWFNNSAVLNSVAGGSLTWTIDKQFKSGSINVAVASAQAPSGLVSSTTITATFNASTPTGRMIAGTSFTGVATISPVDGTPGSASGSGTAWTAGSITTTAADDLIVGASMRDAGADTTSTPAAGYTEAQDFGAGTGDNSTLVYSTSNSAGANNPGGTWLSTGSWASVSIAYKAAAGGSTPVSATRAINYDLIAAVSATRAINYDLIASVSTTRALAYDILMAVAATRAIVYTIAAQVSATRALAYDLIAPVSATRALAYDIVLSVSATRAINYDLIATVSATRAINYDLIATVSATRAVTYDITNATPVSATRALAYDILMAVSATRALAYDLIAPVSATRALAYDITTSVAATRALSYAIISPTSNTRTLTYNIGIVAAARGDLMLLWLM